jgi:quinol monooxygenase YgiN
MQTEEVTVLIQTQLLPECVEQGKSGLLDLAQKVRSDEPDCLAIELAQDLDDPVKITMIEKWSSREAYEGPHMQGEHMQAFIEESAKYFAGPPHIAFFHVTRIRKT